MSRSDAGAVDRDPEVAQDGVVVSVEQEFDGFTSLWRRPPGGPIMPTDLLDTATTVPSPTRRDSAVGGRPAAHQPCDE